MSRRIPKVTPVGWALAGIAVAGLALRLVGVFHGMPFVYNLDEGSHFVQSAVDFFDEGYNPHYFQNPPAFSYLLHFVYVVWFGNIDPVGVGRDVAAQYYGNPIRVFAIGRAVAGGLGVGAAIATYFAGRRFYGVGAGLLGAALMSFAFLPVFYGHLALNDVPTLLPLTIGLLATVVIYERGRWPEYLVAGAALGLATATKYTAAAMVTSIVLAFALRVLADRSRFRAEFPRLVAAGAISLAAFVAANPFSLLTPHEFLASVKRQQHYSAGVDKLGLDRTNGWRYYAWTLTWGFGWIPTALAAIGAGFALRRDWRRASLLLVFVLSLWLFMGSQQRFYGRWLLPIYPALAIFAGYGAMRLAELARPRLRTAAIAAIAVAALAQPIASSIHVDRVLTRDDTRQQARDWLLAHLPHGKRVVIERIVTPSWHLERGFKSGRTQWNAWPRPPGLVEDYVDTLRPSLIDEYASRSYCVVIVGSIQRGRALKEPDKVPHALEYYARLDRDARLVKEFSPVRAGTKLPPFNFDMSYNSYRWNYVRPGPLVQIYELNVGKCRGNSPLRDV